MGHDEWYLMKQGFATGSVTPAKDYVRDEDLKIHQVACYSFFFLIYYNY